MVCCLKSLVGYLLIILLVLQIISCKFPYFEFFHGHLIPFLFTLLLTVHIKQKINFIKKSNKIPVKILSGVFIVILYYAAWLTGIVDDLEDSIIPHYFHSFSIFLIIPIILIIIHLYKKSWNVKIPLKYLTIIPLILFGYTLYIQSIILLHFSDILLGLAIGYLLKNERFIISLVIFVVFCQIFILNIFHIVYLYTSFSKIFIEILYIIITGCALKKVYMES